MKKIMFAALAAICVAGFATGANAQGVRWAERVSWITSVAAEPAKNGVRDSSQLCIAGAAGTMTLDTTTAVSLEGICLGSQAAAGDSTFQFAFVLSPANPNPAGGMATAIDSINVYAQFSANGVTWTDGTGGKSFVSAIGGGGQAGRSFNTAHLTAFAGNSPMSQLAGYRFVRFVVATDFNGCIEGWVVKNLNADYLRHILGR
jgi:hypothetical protein